VEPEQSKLPAQPTTTTTIKGVKAVNENT